ncbi:MAG: LytTR family transcriptional regulator DNA-binding domain-containing protein [Bacteroidota bacterium]|nr:LytTR family transcriptional regulator DNA-binding domain-containing protein [Bacteroidota bacterium]
MTGEIKKVNILIVEDEALVARDIAQNLIDFGYAIIGTAPTVERARLLLLQHPETDIALIDIMLKGDETGIELAKTMDKTYPSIPYIFLTSYADRTTIDRVKSTTTPYAYLLKPFKQRQVMISIEMALENYAKRKPVLSPMESNGMDTPTNYALKINDSLFLKRDNHFERVLLEEILFLEAESNYTTVHTQCGRFVYSMVLKKIEELLPSEFFLRVHRSFVVNINAVTGFEGNLLFVGTQRIPVSKSHREHIFKLFHKL